MYVAYTEYKKKERKGKKKRPRECYGTVTSIMMTDTPIKCPLYFHYSTSVQVTLSYMMEFLSMWQFLSDDCTVNSLAYHNTSLQAVLTSQAEVDRWPVEYWGKHICSPISSSTLSSTWNKKKGNKIISGYISKDSCIELKLHTSLIEPSSMQRCQ